MKRTTTILASASALTLASFLSTQNPSDAQATPNPRTGTAMSSTPPAATPGMQRTPSASEQEFDRSSTPGPARKMTEQERARVTPMPGSDMPTGYPGMRAAGPTAPADCSNNGWSNYANPKFKSQKSCEQWVHSHATKSGQPAKTPRADTNSVARTPVANATPPSSLR